MTKKTTTHEVEEHLITWLASINENLPALPKSFTHTLVQILPWLALIFGLIGVVATIAGLGLSTIFLPLVLLDNGLGGMAGKLASLIISLFSSLLFVAAVPHLRRQRYLGWRLVFWSEVISTISAIFIGSIPGFVFACVGMYFLFQIRSAYK